jgi:hypothetical protein
MITVGLLLSQPQEPKITKGEFTCPLSMCSVSEPVVTHWFETSNIFIGPRAGDVVTTQKNLTHIGRDTVVSWRNAGNGPDRWSPVILYVWWSDGTGGIMINRRTHKVTQCAPPDPAMVSCLPVPVDPAMVSCLPVPVE